MSLGKTFAGPDPKSPSLKIFSPKVPLQKLSGLAVDKEVFAKFWFMLISCWKIKEDLPKDKRSKQLLRNNKVRVSTLFII